ncbi:MAG TPA: hypothetical protein VMU88_10220 [bacterium]|nr:hypothetical protein [bacterium]
MAKFPARPFTTFFLSDEFFCAILAAVAFFPNLFLGQAYFDGDLLMDYGPFQEFLRENIFQGHFPLWNPDLLGGNPMAANPVAMAFYPPLYFCLLFPLPLAFGIFYFLHGFVALWGTHRWLAQWGASPTACRLGAVAFAFSGFFWSEIVHPNLLATYAWMPWFFLALEALVKKPRPSRAFLLGLVLALMFLAGHSQALLGPLYAGPFYFLFRIFTTDNPWRRVVPRFSGWSWAAGLFPVFLLALLPILAFLIPEYEFVSLTDRFGQSKDYLNYNAPFFIQPSRVWQFLFPSPLFDQTGKALPLETANLGYLGVWMPFFSVAAFRAKDRRLPLLALGLAFFSFLTALGPAFPLHRWLCDWAPGFSLFRAPYRYIYLYDFFGAALMALGYDGIFGTKDVKIQRTWLRAGLLYALVLGALGLSALSGPLHWAEFTALGLGAVYLWLKNRRRGREPVLQNFLFCGAFILPLLFSGWLCGTSRWGAASCFDYEKNLPDLSRLREIVGHNRVLVGDGIPYPIHLTFGPSILVPLPTNVTMALGMRNMLGYDLSLAQREKLHQLPLSTFTRLMAVQGYVTGGSAKKVPGYHLEHWASLNGCFADRPMNFLFSPGQVRVFNNEDQEWKAMIQGSVDPEKTVFFSKTPDQGRTPSLDSGPVSFKYSWVKDQPDQESFQVSLEREHWVVFSEMVYPGWKAWLDGRPAPLETADALLRALWCPAGSHLVEFRYEPVWWKPILGGLCLWLFGALVFWFSRDKWDQLWIRRVFRPGGRQRG